jgi:hypothetical protein
MTLAAAGATGGTPQKIGTILHGSFSTQEDQEKGGSQLDLKRGRVPGHS